MPKWMTALEADFGRINTRLRALNVHDAVMTLVEGGCDLLLCYHHPRQPVQLDPQRYDMLVLGTEALRPYARCNRAGVPDYLLPGSIKTPLPFLSYTANAYLGRMVELILNDTKRPLHLQKCYETDMAEGLKMMAMEGHGVVFLPESSVVREVKQRHLARADDGQPEWQVTMEIRLYREQPSPQRPGKPLVARLWDHLVARQAALAKPAKRKSRSQKS